MVNENAQLKYLLTPCSIKSVVRSNTGDKT